MSMVLTLLLAFQATQPPAEPVARERRVCRTAAETGSRLVRNRARVCRTAEEWRRRDQGLGTMDQRQRDMMEEIRPDPGFRDPGA